MISALIVDDDPAFTRLIGERLRFSTEVRITEVAATLEAAIARCTDEGARDFDAVLLDLNLSDAEGLDTVRAVHAAAPRLPIVVLSGQSDVQLAIDAMRCGAQDYVVKASADPANLVRVLRLAIERKRLEDLEKMLVGVVSHDLRAPLQTIALACEVMLADAHPPRHAHTIRRATQRATGLVNDLLDATRARLAGGLPIELREVDVAAVVEHVVEDARVGHPGRSIELTLPDREPMQADARRLAQVVQNLLGNAIQHSPPTSTITVRLARTPKHLELEIHNTGAPIPADLQPRLFEPLERGVASADREHSIGLGLYIVSEIVRAHHGAIHLESTEDKGTTFRVCLPRA